MALIGALAKGLVRGSGSAIARNITGRKKTINPSAIAPKQKNQGQQQQKGGALVKSPTAGITKAMAPVKQVSTGAVAKDDYLGSIHKNVLLIESIVTGVYKAEQDNLRQKKKDEQDDARKNQEEKLETKPQKGGMKKPNINMVPKLGIFGWIKRFIGNILMGLFLQKMVDFAGFLPGIIRAIDGITTFLADFGITMVNALVTFADWGIKAYNFTFGIIEKISGTLFGENADKVVGLIDTALFLTTAIAGSMAVEALTGGGGDDGPGLLDLFGKRGAQAATQQVGRTAATSAATKGTAAAAGAKGTAAAGTVGTGGCVASTAGTVGGVAVGTAAAIITGVGLLASALGEGAFQIKKIGKKPIDDAQKEFDKYSWLNPMKYFWGAALGMQKFLLFPLTATGLALDVIGAPFRYAIELIRFGIMAIMGDTEGMKKQRYNLAKFDSRIREGVRELLNTLTLGLAFTEKGSFGNIFGDEKAQEEMLKKYAEGGSVKKKVKRGIDIKKKKKIKRLRTPKPSPDRMAPLPPMKVLENQEAKNKREWWDFLGWAGTGARPEQVDLGTGGKKLAEKVTEVGNKLGENDYFGPILRVTSKVILDQNVDNTDYQNVGRGINLLLDDGMKKGAIGVAGYNEGGVVKDIPQLDVTKWVKKTFQNNLEKDLKKKYLKFGSTSGSAGERDPSTGVITPSTASAPPGASSARYGSPEMKALLDVLAYAEGTLTNRNGATGPAGYSTWAGYQMHGPTDLTGLTIQEVHDLQTSFMRAGKTAMTGSAVVGRYQFKDLLEYYAPQAGLSGSDLFSPENQDRMAIAEIEKRAGITTQMLKDNGITQGYLDKLAPIWASMPYSPKGGASYYGGQPSKPAGELKDFYNQRLGVQISQQQAAPNPVEPGVPETPETRTGSSRGYKVTRSGRTITNFSQLPPHHTYQRSKDGRGALVQDFTLYKGNKFFDIPVPSPVTGKVSWAGNAGGGGKWVEVMSNSGQKIELGHFNKISVRANQPVTAFSSMLGTQGYTGNIVPKGIDGTHVHMQAPDSVMKKYINTLAGYNYGGIVRGPGGIDNVPAMLTAGEIVIDVDSAGPARDLLLAINQASDKAGIIKAIRDYAPYESGSEQTVVVSDDSEQMPQQQAYGSRSSTPMLLPIPMGDSNPFEFLEYQG